MKSFHSSHSLIFCTALLLSSALPASSQIAPTPQTPLFLLAGKDIAGVPYPEGLYSGADCIQLPQINHLGQTAFRHPLFSSATIHLYSPADQKSSILLEAKEKITTPFGEIKFTLSSYHHRSSPDFRRNFILVERAPAGTPSFTPYIYCHHPQETSANTRQSLNPFPNENKINLRTARLTLAPDNSTVFVYDSDGYFSIFQLTYNAPEKKWEISSRNDLLKNLAFAPIEAAVLAQLSDNSLMLYYMQNKAIYRLKLDGLSSPEKLTTLNSSIPYSLQISNDGRRIIFCDSLDAKSHLFTLHLDEENQQYSKVLLPFVNTDFDYFEPALTPDGRYLVFTVLKKNISTYRKIYRWHFQYQELKEISLYPSSDEKQPWLEIDGDCLHPQISPDGKNIAFITNAKNFAQYCGFSGEKYQIYIRQNIPDAAIDQNHFWHYQLCSYSIGNPNQAPSSTMKKTFRDLQADYRFDNIILTTSAQLTETVHDKPYVYLRSMNAANPSTVSYGEKEFPAISGNGNVHCFYDASARKINLSTQSSISASLNRSPLFSYDGQKMLYIDTEKRALLLYRKSTETAETIKITEFLNPDFTNTVSPLSLSADGQLILYRDNSFLAIRNINEDKTSFLTQLPENITEAVMSAYGTILYYKYNKDIYRYNRLTDTGSAPLSLLQNKNAFRIKCSPNGRFLIYIRKNDNKFSLFRYDSLTQTEQLVTTSPEMTSPHNSAISFSGQRIVFSSPDTFASHITDTNHTSDLYMAIAPEDENTAPEPVAPASLAMTEDTPAVFNFSFTDADGNDACLTKAEVAAEQGEAEILPPSSAHPWYSVRIIPAQDFDGTLNLKLTVSDGQNARTRDFSITVENVNDNPVWSAEFQPITLQEKSSRTINLKDFASDPDLRNPANQEKLSFALAEECSWATISADGILSLKPDQNTVLHQEARKNFQIKLIITDQEKAESEIQILTVTVEDVNQTPVIAFAEQSPRNITENTFLSAAWFQCSDDDAEDQDKLQLILTAGTGTFGNDKVNPLAIHARSSENIQYHSGSGKVTDRISISCKDTANTESGTLNLTIYLKQIDLTISDFWALSQDEADSPAEKIILRAGQWNLLSLPVTVQAKTLLDAFPGSVLRWWNASEQRYLIADANTLLPAGTGFWLYCETLPEQLPLFISGQRHLGNSYPDLTPGWHLLGPVQGLSNDFTAVRLYPALPAARYQAPIFLKPDSTYIPPTGTAAWIWNTASAVK